MLICGLQSCVDSIPIPENLSEAKIVFESEINPTSKFRAHIHTSAGFNDINNFTYPEDVEVNITYQKDIDDIIMLVYKEECQCYENDIVSPLPGVGYVLSASVNDNTIYKDIEARMSFPHRPAIDNNIVSLDIADSGQVSIKSKLTLSGNHNSSNYYHIIPYRKVVKKEDDGNGGFELTYTGESEYIDLIDFNNNDVYMESLYDQPGFLLDFNEEVISDYDLNLLLTTTSGLLQEDEIINKVYFEIRSVTESYYRYELYQSRKLASIEDGTVEPPISYNNIKNGLGYFGGYSMVVDSFDITL